MLEGKTIYAGSTCLRLGRGGCHRSRKYKTEARCLRVLVFTDDTGKAIDLVIGDEHDADINLLRGKLDEVTDSRASAFNHKGAASSVDVVCALTKAGIEPLIPASVDVVAAARRKPPPEMCIREKKEEEKIRERYAKDQADYEKWGRSTGYSVRWVYSEGRFSVLKRMCRNQKSVHDEVCTKLMIADG